MKKPYNRISLRQDSKTVQYCTVFGKSAHVVSLNSNIRNFPPANRDADAQITVVKDSHHRTFSLPSDILWPLCEMEQRPPMRCRFDPPDV